MARAVAGLVAAMALATVALRGSEAFEVYPAFQSVRAQPGTEVNATYWLTGTRGKGAAVLPSESVSVSLLDFRIGRDGRETFEAIEGWKYSARRWVTFESLGRLDLSIGAKRPLTLKIHPPLDAIPGTYFVGLAIEPVAPDNKGALQVSTRAIAPLFFEVIGPPAPVRIEIERPSIVVRSSSSKATTPGASAATPPAQVPRLALTLANLSARMVMPRVEATFRGGDLRVWDVLPVRAQGGSQTKDAALVQPESLRDFEVPLSRWMPPGDYTVDIRVDLGAAGRVLRSFLLTLSSEASDALKGRTSAPVAVNTNAISFVAAADLIASRSVEITNVSLNPLTIAIESDANWLVVEPEKLVGLAPGRTGRVRIRVRRPPLPAPGAATTGNVRFRPPGADEVVVPVTIRG